MLVLVSKTNYTDEHFSRVDFYRNPRPFRAIKGQSEIEKKNHLRPTKAELLSENLPEKKNKLLNKNDP